jgi:hypothetical protein
LWICSTFFAHCFFPLVIAANQTAYHLNIFKAYTWQIKNARFPIILQLIQRAQILRRGIKIMPQRSERAGKRHRKRTKP